MSKELPWPDALPVAPTEQPPGKRRRWRLLLALILLPPLIWLGFKLGRLGLEGWRAYSAAVALQTALVDERATVAAPLAQLTQSLAAAQQDAQFLTPLLSRLQPLPRYGPTIAAMPILLQVGAELAGLAQWARPLLEPARDAGLDQLPTLVDQLHPHQAELTGRLARIQGQLAQVAPEQLTPALADLVTDLQSSVAVLHGAALLGDELPALLGLDGEAKEYLILVQNNHELRSTGGFLSSIGVVTLEQGRIGHIDFQDSYNFGSGNAPYTVAPEPIQRYMQIDRLLLRDANWSPDLPTTAQVTAALYAESTGVVVDGVITLDLQAAALLVGALEPLSAPGLETPVTQANFLDLVKTLWADPVQTDATITSDVGDWWEQRKDFIPLLAAAALARLEEGAVDPVRLLAMLGRALETRSIQIWTADRATTDRLAQLGWDGGLHPVAGQDFLALVDTNMGYNKVDAVIERSLRYTVTWPAGQERALATAQITYRHLLNTPDPECLPLPRYGLVYDDLIARCYFNFLRLYTPAGSELVSINGVDPDSVLEQRSEVGTQLFGGYVVVPPGTAKTVTVSYRLPATLQPHSYHLLLQRQAGSAPLALSVDVGGVRVEQVVAVGRWAWARE